MAQSQIKRPDQIKAYLDKYVIGQDEAKKALSVAVYNHYKRILHKDDPERKVNVEKSNILMLGPTGCGKTHLVKTVARMLGVPCYIGSATSLTASGYVGDDIESLLTGLLMNCNYDIEKSKHGIIFIDEIDKIAKKDAGVSITRDVSGECVQQGLLKMVEGHVMGVPPMGGRKHPEQPLLYVDTSDILFICAGAFVGLEEIISRRIGQDRSRIGFQNQGCPDKQGQNLLSEVSAQDLRDFGMIPEFVGRIPVVTYVNPLDKEALERILTEPKDCLLAQYTELFREDGIRLKFSPEVIRAVAEEASELGTGARGLRCILERLMRELMFSAPKEAAKSGRSEILVTPGIFPTKEGKHIRIAE